MATQPVNLGQADRRVRRTLRRLLIELFRLRAEQTALREMTGLDHFGYDFFKVTHTALHGDRLLRLVRIFDEDGDAASFWYICNCLSVLVQRAVESVGLSIDELRDFSKRLKRVRKGPPGRELCGPSVR